MKEYPTYKDSGVEWIGRIPEHWEIKPLRYILKRGKEGIRIGPFGSSLKYEVIKSSGYKIYGQGNVIRNDFEYGHKYIDAVKFAELEDYEIVAGDIVITMMGTTGKSKIVPPLKDRGIMDSHLIRIRPDKDKVLPRLLSTLINDSDYLYHNRKILSKGSIMEGLNSSIIKSLMLVLPPVQEQTAIANFLDHKTAQIDASIEKRRQLIELLQEQRAALINEAVTKGINPDVPMKDSGVEWIGEVPEHWLLVKMKFVASLRSGDSITSEKIKPENTFPVYGGNGLRGYTDDYTHEGLHVLIGRQGALCGNINYADNKFWASEHAVVCTLVDNYVVTWFGELLRTMNLNQYSVSAAQPGLSVDRIKNLQIPVPPISEQLQIGYYIKNETTLIDKEVGIIQKEINLLKEYRQSLISEAVTGKIDVRDYPLS